VVERARREEARQQLLAREERRRHRGEGEGESDPESREDEGDEPSERSRGKTRLKQVHLSNVLVLRTCCGLPAK
jgi:hypothetical protein